VALASREKEHGTTGYDRTLHALEALPALGVALAKRRFTVVLAPVRIVADDFFSSPGQAPQRLRLLNWSSCYSRRSRRQRIVSLPGTYVDR
jgi:hypothetical protein